MTELLGFLGLTPAELIHIGIQLAVAIYGVWAMKDWGKLKDLAEEKSLEVADKALSKEEKRMEVAQFIFERVPAKIRPFVSRKMIYYLVDWVYQNRVRPHIKRQLDKEELEKIKSDVEKHPGAVKEIDDILRSDNL